MVPVVIVDDSFASDPRTGLAAAGAASDRVTLIHAPFGAGIKSSVEGLSGWTWRMVRIAATGTL